MVCHSEQARSCHSERSEESLDPSTHQDARSCHSERSEESLDPLTHQDAGPGLVILNAVKNL
jgi:hypothetical protein